MQGLLRGVLAASILLGAADAAQAARSIDAQGFSARLVQSENPNFNMTVLSDTGSAVKVALSGVGLDDLWGRDVFEVSSQEGCCLTSEPWEEVAIDVAFTQLNFNVKPGYRIASFTFSGTTFGTLTPAVVPPQYSHPGNDLAGTAHSVSTWSLSTTQVGTWETHRSVVDQSDINGSQSFSLDHDYPIMGEFELSLMSLIRTELRSAYTQPDRMEFPAGRSFASSASLDIRDLALSVNLVPVAAVPEPGTYAMLLAGLALLGVAARRRR